MNITDVKRATARRRKSVVDAAMPPTPAVPAVVLKMVADNFSHGRVAAVRTLGRMGVPVVGVHERRLTPAALSRYDRNPFVIDLKGRSSDRVKLDALVGLGRQLGQRPMLLPTDDVGTLFVDQHADQLHEVFRFPRQPSGLVVGLADKGKLHRMCLELGFGTPDARFPQSREEFLAGAEELGYPVMVKSMDSRVLWERPQARSVGLARDPDRLLEIYDEWEDPAAPNLMLQQYIPGGPETCWMFNGYFNEKSECLIGVTGRKLRQHPPRTGATTLGLCETNDEVMRLTRDLMRAVGYRGIVDMGWRYDERDGQYKLLDVNPRVGATFRLFVTSAGVDVVQAQYLDLIGEAVPKGEMVSGRRWMVEPSDVWTASALRREGDLTWRQWLSSLRNVDEFGWMAVDDPLPFAAMTAYFFGLPAREWVKGRTSRGGS